MKLIPESRLFWFLKGDRTLDLTKPAVLDMYVQQILSRGRTEDVKALFKNVEFEQFRQSFLRIAHFLPFEVKAFWEDFLGSYQSSSKNNTG